MKQSWDVFICWQTKDNINSNVRHPQSSDRQKRTEDAHKLKKVEGASAPPHSSRQEGKSYDTCWVIIMEEAQAFSFPQEKISKCCGLHFWGLLYRGHHREQISIQQEGHFRAQRPENKSQASWLPRTCTDSAHSSTRLTCGYLISLSGNCG